MTTKIDIRPIVRSHYATLRNAGAERLSRLDAAVFIALPIVLATLTTVWPLHIRIQEPEAVLNLVGILFGFLAAIYFFVIERAGRSDHTKSKSVALVETQSNVGYAALVLLAILSVLCIEAFAPPSTDETLRSCIISFIVVGGLLHFGLTMLMVLKRLHLVATG